jgi:predicted small metal-binding protein
MRLWELQNLCQNDIEKIEFDLQPKIRVGLVHIQETTGAVAFTDVNSYLQITQPITKRRTKMAKVLRCDDVMPGCQFEARGTEEEVMKKAAEHARKEHNITNLTPEIVNKVKAAIAEE